MQRNFVVRIYLSINIYVYIYIHTHTRAHLYIRSSPLSLHVLNSFRLRLNIFAFFFSSRSYIRIISFFRSPCSCLRIFWNSLALVYETLFIRDSTGQCIFFFQSLPPYPQRHYLYPTLFLSSVVINFFPSRIQTSGFESAVWEDAVKGEKKEKNSLSRALQKISKTLCTSSRLRWTKRRGKGEKNGEKAARRTFPIWFQKFHARLDFYFIPSNSAQSPKRFDFSRTFSLPCEFFAVAFYALLDDPSASVSVPR